MGLCCIPSTKKLQATAGVTLGKHGHALVSVHLVFHYFHGLCSVPYMPCPRALPLLYSTWGLCCLLEALLP